MYGKSREPKSVCGYHAWHGDASGCFGTYDDGMHGQFAEQFPFNIIWSLQMPLFILISGYVTKYSRPISDGNGLWKYVKRRTVAYMLPWAVWSFLVRGIIFGEDGFLNVKHLLWNMDSGYWFLATIWTISMILVLRLSLQNG